MKVLLSWMQEFAPGIAGDPVELGDHMSDLGMAVEEMELIGEGLDGIVVAEVKALNPHPNADRIQLVQVDPGDGEELQVCCGAFNMAVGDRIPFATIGTVMPNGMEIGRRKMRGEWSNGMCCSGQEIGVGDDHDGILILDPDLALGTPITDALGIEPDVLWDLEINPNRPDAMSVAGVARDLAARLGVPFSLPDPQVPEEGIDAGQRASVEIHAPDFCDRFVVRVLDNVTIGTSPSWMQQRLLALGMRPINSVVDVSNYVMLELGQPNHTYDLDKVAGAKLGVRMATEGETLVTLDDVERTLTEHDGVIVDGDDVAIGIAGVMGGASTEISETTTSVLLELAHWHPMTIAKSSRRLGLRSEASARFDKGTDPFLPELAARRFAELLAATGATLAPGTLVETGNLAANEPVRLRTSRVNAIVGIDVTVDEIIEILTPIGFEATAVGEDCDVLIPTFRPDTTVEIDLVEEVARHYGYENVVKTVPRPDQTGSLTEHQQDRRRVRSAMTGLGLDEIMPVPFLAPGDLERAKVDPVGIRVANPLVAEESIMRTSLRPGMLKTLAYNASHRNTGLGVFEVGHVYAVPETEQRLPDEREFLGVALGGRDARVAVDTWIALADALAVRDYQLVTDETDGLHATRTARVEVAGTPVGYVGEIDPGVAEAYGVPERIGWLEIDLDLLLSLPHGERPYHRISRFPSSDLDLAFVVDETTPAGLVADTLRAAAGDLLQDLTLFDVFRGGQLGDQARSLAYSLRFQAEDRTLTDEDLAEVQQRCIAAVEAAHPAKLRG